MLADDRGNGYQTDLKLDAEASTRPAEQPTTVVHSAKASAPVGISPSAAITSTVPPEAQAALPRDGSARGNRLRPNLCFR